MKPSGIGGQAVIEGVMMKNADEYAVAVRKPDNEIIVKKDTFVSKSKKWKIFKVPVFRGILAFVESMQIGVKTLTYSAGFYEEEEASPSKLEKGFNKLFKEKAESVLMGITVVLAIALAIGIFMLLPMFLANLLGKVIDSDVLRVVVEGVLRIFIFIGYVFAISQMKDIKRVFMYHGAEHKTINCLENGFELSVENVRWQSKQHKRCGTSFMLVVMIISVVFFMFIRVENIWLRMLFRILLIPVIAGVSYEFIKLAGRSDNKIVNILSKPGLWLQGLTTREPDDSMIEVAIQSVDAVFDWKEYLQQFSNQDKKKGQRLEAAAKRRAAKKQSEEKNPQIEGKKEPEKKSKRTKGTALQEGKAAFEENEERILKESFEAELPEINEEEDEILKALDHYFFDENEKKRENKK